jgi:hypothetical protein
MDVMKEIGRRTQPVCPRCGTNPSCAVEAGKSINTCWCVHQKLPESLRDEKATACYCRRCLRELIKEETHGN